MTQWSRQISSLRRVAFDTNAVIYYIQRRAPYSDFVAQVMSMLEAGEALGFVSVLVEMELLVQPLRDRDNEALEKIGLLFRDMPNLIIRPVDRAVAAAAANVRSSTRLDPVDSIVAATALVDRCEGIIGNDAVFARRFNAIPYLFLEDYVV